MTAPARPAPSTPTAVPGSTASPEAGESVGAAVELRGITIRAGRRTLLENVDAVFQSREVTLLVGPSGTGKSLLLRVIAGLMDASHAAIRVDGSLTIGGDEVLGRPRRHAVGVVFQHFALFDELSPLENVAFAHAHRSHRADPASTAPAQLLDELGVPRAAHVSRLSGGQQQRLAIARTLSADPEVVLYDEPTSGLDAVASERVAQRIAATHAAHPKTAIVVTHDYESLLGIADRVYALDATRRTLVEIERERWSTLRSVLAPVPATTGETAAPPSLRERLLRGAESFLADTWRAVAAVLQGPLALLPLWRSPRWGLRYLAHYLRLVAGPSAFVYIAVAGAILGFVATHFTFEYLPYAGYTEPLIQEEVLGTIGYGLFRILVPLIATILVAARCGAAVASDVGNKTYGRQLDALRSFAAPPRRYLLTSVLWSFLVGTPLLVLAAFALARWTSLVVFTAGHPDLGPWFWDQHLHAQLRVPGHWLWAGAGWVLAKTLTAAFGVGLIAYHQGARPKPSATAVSGGITRAILWSTLWVLVVHFAFAFVEFQPPG